MTKKNEEDEGDEGDEKDEDEGQKLGWPGLGSGLGWATRSHSDPSPPSASSGHSDRGIPTCTTRIESRLERG